MRVESIMTKEVISVEPNASAIDIAQLLFKHGIHGVPVIDKGKLAGLVTESDFFLKDFPSTYLPSYIEYLKNAQLTNELEQPADHKVDKILKTKAKDIMSRDCFTISPRYDVKDLIRLFKHKRLYIIPVVEKDNTLVGIITLADIIKLIK